ncbi:MAG: hypothetical protein LBB74_07795 [Chitinispirillales bacterium]|jgi:hypothetical protein|nr:hypothetical protein [Chitinispirillales bacterium]
MVAEIEKDKKDLRSGEESGILKGVDRNSISSPIEAGRTDGVGEPWAIARHGKPLNDRQQALLDKLPGYDSKAEVDKSDISMMDLAALTAKTGDEFAMFTRGSKRLVVRGNDERVNINPGSAAELSAQGYKWSGHTHPGDSKTVLHSSEGDKDVLKAFKQGMSVIYNSLGQYQTFDKKGKWG